MVCGFLGTLIGVERAVALGAFWPYAAGSEPLSGWTPAPFDGLCAWWAGPRGRDGGLSVVVAAVRHRPAAAGPPLQSRCSRRVTRLLCELVAEHPGGRRERDGGEGRQRPQVGQ